MFMFKDDVTFTTEIRVKKRFELIEDKLNKQDNKTH